MNKIRMKVVMWGSIICFALCSGCAISQIRPLFQYQISPPSSKMKIDKLAGLNDLLDNRPLAEKKELPPDSLLKQSVSNRITSILLMDLEKSQLFKEVHYPARPTDDIVITGSIKRFLWGHKQTSWGKFYDSPIGQLLTILFLPSRLPSLLGAPENQEYCTVDISLEVKDKKRGAIITQFRESSTKERRLSSCYGTKFGQSADDAFCNVANKFKKELIEKINSYFDSQLAGVVGEE